MREAGPSSTAQVIALAMVLLGRDPLLRTAVSEEAAAAAHGCLKASTLPWRLLARAVGTAPGRAAARVVERLVLPGIVRHYAARKLFIQRAVERSRAEGYGRLIVLGAGCDGLALRMAGRGMPAVEIDHPATQRLKRRMLALHSGCGAPELRAFDLTRDSLDAALDGASTTSEGVVVVAEGLLMYLDHERVGEVFAQIAAMPAARVRVIFTFMRPGRDGAGAFEGASRLVNVWLGWKKEPFAWCCDPARVADVLEPAGFRVREIAGGREMATLLPRGGGRALEGEVVCVAEAGA
jgi:methyltransferase (TIGR00027 family)